MKNVAFYLFQNVANTRNDDVNDESTICPQ